MRACHAADPCSIPGREKFPVWCFFRGFSSPVRQMSGNCKPTRSPNIIWPSSSSSSSSSSFHIRLVTMNGCVTGVYRLSCSCCIGSDPAIEVNTHSGKPSMSLCGKKSMYVIQKFIPFPDRSWLCTARAV